MKYLILTLPLLMAACAPARMAAVEFADQAEMAADKNKALVQYGQCPATFVVDELAFLKDYAPHAKRVDSQLKSRVAMSKSSSSCEYDKQSVSVDMTLEFRGQLGPKGSLRKDDDPLYSYPFFVAITNSGGKILAKQIFAATMPYPSNGQDGFYTETIRQIIPVPSQQQGKLFAVMAGFQLTDEQLEENRDFIKQTQLEARRAAAEKRRIEKLNNTRGSAGAASNPSIDGLRKFTPTDSGTLVPSGR